MKNRSWPRSRVKSGFIAACAVVLLSTGLAKTEKAEAAESFSDVSDQHWASEPIQRLADQRIINGYSDGTYRPGEEINRGQVAELLTTAFDLNASEDTASTFNDLSSDSYYTPYAEAVKQAGYMTGRSDNTQFAAGMDLSRQQMATIIVRAFEFERIDDSTPVRDIEAAGESHRPNIEILAQHGVNQTKDGAFRPEETVTREQFAVFLDRAMAKAHTIDSGIKQVLAYDRGTVDVSFNKNVSQISIDDFSFEPPVVVLSAAFVDPEDSFASNRDAETVVRLTTGEHEVQGHQFYYKGQRTDQIVEGSD